jgi:hypothetical protein
MAANPRRFRVWPRENLTGRARIGAFAEGVMFTDGTVVVRWLGNVPTSVVYPDRGMDAIDSGNGFGGPGEVEWLDGNHG